MPSSPQPLLSPCSRLGFAHRIRSSGRAVGLRGARNAARRLARHMEEKQPKQLNVGDAGDGDASGNGPALGMARHRAA